MGTPALVCSGNLNPTCQQYVLYGKYELYKKPSFMAFGQSFRSCNSPLRVLSTKVRITPLPRTRAFPDLPLRKDVVSCPSSPLRRRRDLRCRAEAGQSFQSALKLTETIQTDSLPPSVRDSTMRAIDDLGRRVTNGDVASRAGLKVTQAESALQALAADSGGYLEVWMPALPHHSLSFHRFFERLCCKMDSLFGIETHVYSLPLSLFHSF